jgi:hypothetical protein
VVLAQITFCVVGIAVTLVLLRRAKRALADEKGSSAQFIDTSGQTHWTVWSVGSKMLICAVATVSVVGGCIMWVRAGDPKFRETATTAGIVAWLVASGVTGAFVGFCLALRERLLEQRSKGRRINPALRAYLCSGYLSLTLWIVTGLAAAIGGIFIYGAILMDHVKRGHN